MTGTDRLDRLIASARQTGTALAAIGITIPSAAARTYTSNWNVVFGEREERFEEVLEGVADEEPDGEAGDRAQNGDLDADEHGANRELSP